MTTPAIDERPTSIELDRTSHLKLGWTDGLTAVFGITDLRLACPCAGCRNRRDQGLRAIPEDPRPIAATQVRLVGSYALGIDWVDTKCNSIYTFDILRQWAEQGAASEPSVGDHDPARLDGATDTTVAPDSEATIADSGSFS